MKTKVIRIAQAIPNLNFQNSQTCLDDEMSLGLVIRDIDLGTANQVTGTPTLVINGHRIQGVKDAMQLRQLIAEAAKEAGTETKQAALSGANRRLSAKAGSSIIQLTEPDHDRPAVTIQW